MANAAHGLFFLRYFLSFLRDSGSERRHHHGLMRSPPGMGRSVSVSCGATDLWPMSAPRCWLRLFSLGEPEFSVGKGEIVAQVGVGFLRKR